MAANTKPKKPYKPRYAEPGYMLLPQQRDAIVLPVHLAMGAMETGAADLRQRHALASFLNVISLLCMRMKVSGATPEIVVSAMHALASSDKRYKSTGRFGFSGPEMLAMREAITAGDKLLKRANSAVVLAAVKVVSKLITEEVVS